jgi:hypothetical protein
VLATVLDRCVARRSLALRRSYAPEELTSTVAGVAQQMLGGSYGLAGALPGGAWVIPQVRWLHEMDRLFPYGRGAPDKHAPAPPMDYPLPGMKQQQDAKLGHRLRALRRHPLSMELAHNRPIACTAIAGEDDHAEFAQDLGMVALGYDPEEQLGQVCEAMRVGSWLEAVLSWLRTFVLPFEDPAESLPFLSE